MLTVWLSISIHAPRVGGDILWIRSAWVSSLFQSTPPVWGATGEDALVVHAFHLISIHAPRVGGDNGLDHEVGDLCISIHAPRVGGDYFFASSG